MNSALDKYLELNKSKIESYFYTSGRDNITNRKLAKELTWKLIEKHINDLLHVGTYVEGSGFLLKPTGEFSELSPHQDSSLIDETKFFSYFGWIPLQDTNVTNGGITVIPKSHLWGINYRSLDIPWLLKDYENILKKYSIPIEVKAGEILFFETALIHGSLKNISNSLMW